jgi:hypothetical protein
VKVEIECGKCPICGRYMNKKNSNLHHLTPKLKGGKTTQENMVRLHIVCHSKIHSLWSESQLMYDYDTIEKIMLDERMIKFAKWISTKNPNDNFTNKMTKTHKRKKRK